MALRSQTRASSRTSCREDGNSSNFTVAPKQMYVYSQLCAQLWAFMRSRSSAMCYITKRKVVLLRGHVTACDVTVAINRRVSWNELSSRFIDSERERRGSDVEPDQGSQQINTSVIKSAPPCHLSCRSLCLLSLAPRAFYRSDSCQWIIF